MSVVFITLIVTYDLWPFVDLYLQNVSHKWIAHNKLTQKCGITDDSMSTGSKYIFLLAPAAILAAILNISNCSRISAWYPLDIRYRGPKDVESSQKKTISVGAGLGPKISFGDLTNMVCFLNCGQIRNTEYPWRLTQNGMLCKWWTDT